VLAPDRSIYNVREMPVAQGGVATDALRAIPELEVDVDDNVRARGGEPQIFLDGRPLPMQGEARKAFLRTLRADRIDRVEYIPNPSARYEADGQSGIVNIVLRRDVGLGFSGSATANVGTLDTQNVSSRLNYQRGPLTFFGGALLGFNQSRSSSFDLRENLAATPVTYLQQSTGFRQNGVNSGADVTAELKLSDRATAWAIVRGNLGDSDDAARSEFIHMDGGQSPTDRYGQSREQDNGTHSFSTALGYRRVVEPQRNELSAELRYGAGGSAFDTDSRRTPFSLTGEDIGAAPDLTLVRSDDDDDSWSFQVDVARPLAARTRVDFGYRGNLRSAGNDLGVEFRTEEGEAEIVRQDGRFRYAEDYHAAYLTLDQGVGNLAMQAGLRAERVDGESRASTLTVPIATEDNRILPSANLAYQFGQGRQLRLSYSNRVQRPAARSYNPLNSSPIDPYNRSVGNPLLTPAEIHTASLDASWSGTVGTLRASQFYGRGSRFWTATRQVDANGVATIMPENIASAEMMGLGINASLRQMGPLSGFINLNIQNISFDAGSSNLTSNSFTVWQTNANVTATLPRAARLQVTGGFSPAQGSPEGRSSRFRQINFALTQRVWQERGVVTLSVVDPFNFSEYTSIIRNASVEQTARTTNRIRRATLTFTYNFGRAPQSTRRVLEDPAASGGGQGGF